MRSGCTVVLALSTSFEMLKRPRFTESGCSGCGGSAFPLCTPAMSSCLRLPVTSFEAFTLCCFVLSTKPGLDFPFGSALPSASLPFSFDADFSFEVS